MITQQSQTPTAVSVVIPTYNHREFILNALDSVFAQTFRDFEVIVVNDGSPDDTAEVLRPLAEAGRITYIEQPNRGQAAARNRGLAEARGEFIAFLDDDDLWPPEKLEWQVAALRDQSDAGVVGGPAEIVDTQGKHLRWGRQLSGEISFERLFSGNPFSSPGQTLIRAAALRTVGGFDHTIRGADDWDVWFRLRRIHRIITFPRTALFYRVHALNASRDVHAMFLNCAKVIHRHLSAVSDAERARVSRDAYRSLYRYLGNRLLVNARHGARTGAFRQAASTMLALRSFARPALHDSDLRRQMARDILPGFIRRRMRNVLPI